MGPCTTTTALSLKTHPVHHIRCSCSCRQPEDTYRMMDLGIDSPDALNDYAVCSPFQLLSAKAVSALRAELDSDAVQASCKYTSARTPW